MTNWHTINSNEVLEKLSTTENGIAPSEAQRRLQTYGYNELKEKKRASPVILFLNQFKSFLVLILIIAAVISYVIDNVVDAVLIVIIIVANAILGFIQEFKAEKTLESLRKLSAPQAEVIRNGEERMINARELVPGDILLVREGDKIPADARIIEIANLKVDESSLTGESIPISKTDKVLGDVVLSDRKNMVYTGTVVTYGRAKGVVVNTGMNSEIGQIATLIETAEEETPLQSKVNVFGKWLGLITVAIAVISGGIGIVKGYPIHDMFLTSAALAVAAVPEGLPALLTITLAIGVQIMGKQKAFVRKLSAVETLGSTTIILADKTGTMTTNEMTVEKIFVNAQEISVSGNGFNPTGEFSIKGKSFNPSKNNELMTALTISALCNDAVLSKNGDKWKIIGDPTEGALITVAKKAEIDSKELSKKYPRINEIPFSSDRKMMSTAHEVNKKFFVYTKGAPEILLSKCNRILRNSREMKLSQLWKDDILSIMKDYASNGLRVLGVAYKETKSTAEKEMEKDLIFVGLIGMMDPPRSEVKEAIKICNGAGIRVVMITGDHRDTAVAIAKNIGLMDGGKVLTGEELDKMSDQQLEKIADEVEVYARVSPAHKSKIVKMFKKKGHVAAVTGDGINDAPALKNAHIGVAMGIKGTDVAKEASEMVLADDNFATIVKAVEEGRGIYDNIRKFIRYMLSANFGEVIIISLAILLGLPLPLLPIQLLWINLVTDGLPALALGFDTKEKDIMRRKPRDPKEGILSKLVPFMIGGGILFGLSGLVLFYEEYTNGTLEKARTIAFSAVVMFELLFVFNCRSETNPIWKTNIFSNKFLLASVILGLLLQIALVYIPFFNTIFKTVPLNLVDWLIITVVSSSGLLIIPKLFIRQPKMLVDKAISNMPMKLNK